MTVFIARSSRWRAPTVTGKHQNICRFKQSRKKEKGKKEEKGFGREKMKEDDREKMKRKMEKKVPEQACAMHFFFNIAYAFISSVT